MSLKLKLTPFLFIILLAFIGRIVFLEYVDLIDPTESRYAFVAQQMLQGDDYITPMLPTTKGIEPYLSKPPLHYWLTALSYKLFGIDEWTARLPSLFAAILIVLVVYHFSKYFYGRDSAIWSVIFLITSSMFFFLAGASVTDVTLTAFITLSVASLYYSFTCSAFRIWQVIGVSAAALAFLTKGPVALVLISFPLFLWALLSKEFIKIKKLFSLINICIFLAIAGPWFIINEIQHPGFLNYFILNENFGRYLYKEYGDRYGAGHHYPYGMAWIMLFLAFLPWTPLLIWRVFSKTQNFSKIYRQLDSNNRFILVWILSTPLFLTLIKNLHGMYVLPAIPPLAIASSLLLKAFIVKAFEGNIRRKSIFAISIWAIIILIGILIRFDISSLYISIGILLFAIFILVYIQKSIYSAHSYMLPIVILITYILVFPAFTPYINHQRSSEEILKQISLFVSRKHPRRNMVSVLSDNSYSSNWTANAGENELPFPLKIKMVKNLELLSKYPRILLVKGNDIASRIELLKSYTLVRTLGAWNWYIIKTASKTKDKLALLY